jgi:hypothetical protein
MPRLRPRLMALVIACALFLIAYVAWTVADEPLVYLKGGPQGRSEPLWVVAGGVLIACPLVVGLAIILAAPVVAVGRARRQRSWAAAGNVVAAAIVVIGPAAGIAGHLRSPDTHAPLYLLALALGVLVGIAVLANAAARAQSDRRTATLMVVPAAILSLVLLVAFAASVAYAVNLASNGVPLTADQPPGFQAYPIDALPTGYAYLLPALIVSMVVSLAALSSAAFATVGVVRIRDTQTKEAPAGSIIIDLDITRS